MTVGAALSKALVRSGTLDAGTRTRPSCEARGAGSRDGAAIPGQGPLFQEEGCQLTDPMALLPSFPEKGVLGMGAAALVTEAGGEMHHSTCSLQVILGRFYYSPFLVVCSVICT